LDDATDAANNNDLSIRELVVLFRLPPPLAFPSAVAEAGGRTDAVHPGVTMWLCETDSCCFWWLPFPFVKKRIANMQ
jgi:hypothetical protein